MKCLYYIIYADISAAGCVKCVLSSLLVNVLKFYDYVATYYYYMTCSSVSRVYCSALSGRHRVALWQCAQTE